MSKIVLGYDGSDCAWRALERAAELADDDPVTIVSATSTLHRKGRVRHDPMEKENEDRHLDEAAARLAELGVESLTVQCGGDPAKVITLEAKDTGADMILLGTDHKNILERLLLGSVSSGVVRRAPCDVLVVG